MVGSMPQANQGIRVGAAGVIVRNGALLLVEFDDASGLHYNLPGGGLEPGETLREAAAREVREEVNADVDVGRLLLTWEYAPKRVNAKYGTQAKVVFAFECHLRAGQEPSLPARPDPNQTGVRWVPFEHLPTVALLPDVAAELVDALTRGAPQDLHEVRA